MARKQPMNYFDTFIKLMEYGSEAAQMLHNTLSNFNPQVMPSALVSMHRIEHDADEVRHQMMSQLAKEFITPIEREDILEMACVMDDVTDAIEEVLIRLYMYNITSLRAEALAFSQIIVDCCDALNKAVKEFPHFKKSVSLHRLIVEVNRLEEVGDAQYTNVMRNLYTGTSEPILVSAWTNVFDQLEKCCDACEEVANVMEVIVMKNT